MNTKVRYSISDDTRKNTLFTIRIGDFIYFGIARCNLKHDKFNKHIGRISAEKRAMSVHDWAKTDDGTIRVYFGTAQCALRENNTVVRGSTDGQSMTLAKNCLSGVCNINSLKMLRDYFDNIDTEMKPQYKETK